MSSLLKLPKEFIIIPILLMAMSLSCNVQGSIDQEGQSGALSAILSEISGEVFTRKPGEQDFLQATETMILEFKSQVQTMKDSRARVDMMDGSIIRLGPLTLFTLESGEESDAGLLSRIKIEAGELWIILRGGSIEVETPSGLATVRGSFMNVAVNPTSGEVLVTCLEGRCNLTNQGGSIDLVGGQTGRMPDNSTPPVMGNMSDADVQRWLQFNPEAREVLPPLTATAGAAPDVITTEEPPIGEPPPPPPPEEGPAEPLVPMLTVNQDSVCHTGPSRNYEVVGTVFKGESAEVVGRGADSYWVIKYPSNPEVTCWIRGGVSEVSESAYDQPLITPSPEPAPTRPPVATPDPDDDPDEEHTESCCP